MPHYVFVGGPLAEQATSLPPLHVGDQVTIEVTDLYEDLQALPRFVYAIEDEASQVGRGRLRFTSGAAPGRTGTT